MGKSLIGCKCCVKHLTEKNLLSGSRSITSGPNFKILSNCIHELLNVFEDSAQHVHTIARDLHVASYMYNSTLGHYYYQIL